MISRLLPCALALMLFVPLDAAAQRPPVRLIDPVSQPLNRAAFEARVNELSAAMDAIGGAPGATVPVRKVGKVTVPSSGAWVDVYRFAPGNSKRGAVFVQLHGETDAPSNLIVSDLLGYQTSVTGTVFVLGPYGNPDNTGAAGVPGTPAAPGAMAGASSVALTWAAVTPASEGWQAQVSIDAGSTWVNVGNKFYDRKSTGTTFTGLAGAMAAVKFRVRAFNGFGFSAWSSVTDATTGGTHTSDALPLSQLGHWPLPVTEVAWDDLEGGHFYGVSRLGASGGTGDLIIQAIGSTNNFVIRAKTQNSKTGTVRYILDVPPV